MSNNDKDGWQKLLSQTRFDNTPPSQVGSGTTLRSAFHIDYDRVVFSRAFRRLARKTQVHPLAANDHTHNRLTHSLEVASVGRNLGEQIGRFLQEKNHLPLHYHPNDIGTIVQVACLAHDLGNPPFGHTGEDAIREWFKQPANTHYLATLSELEKSDICTYEGNAHSLRRVASLEMYEEGGMRLTAASLGTLLKYPWTSEQAKKGKFNIYQSELKLMQHLADTLGLKSLGNNRWQRHPLSYLMEAADDICYAILDLEDAVEIGILSIDNFCQTLAPLSKVSKHANLGMVRSIAVNNAIKQVVAQFKEHYSAIMAGEFPTDLLDVCYNDTKETLKNAKALARTHIFTHKNNTTIDIASFGCIAMILDNLVLAVFNDHHHHALSKKDELILKMIDFKPQDNLSLIHI